MPDAPRGLLHKAAAVRACKRTHAHTITSLVAVGVLAWGLSCACVRNVHLAGSHPVGKAAVPALAVVHTQARTRTHARTRACACTYARTHKPTNKLTKT